MLNVAFKTEVSFKDRLMTSRPWPNGAKLSDMAVNANKMTEKWVPSLAALTPGAGCYLSEVGYDSPIHSAECY